MGVLVPIATLGTATASGHSTFCGGASSDSTQTMSSPDSELTDAAVRWVRTAKFEPVCRATQAVRVRVAIPVDFKREL